MKHCNEDDCNAVTEKQCLECFLTDLTGRLYATNTKLIAVMAERDKLLKACRQAAAAQKHMKDVSGAVHRIAVLLAQMDEDNKRLLN